LKYKKLSFNGGTGVSLVLNQENPCILAVYQPKNDMEIENTFNIDTGKYGRNYPCPRY
jgi:hypothetical protein